jgi:hypothetical protein
MGCNNCGHEHTLSEQPTCFHTTDAAGNELRIRGVEPTHQICPECNCTEFSATDYEDRIALIKAGELDG